MGSVAAIEGIIVASFAALWAALGVRSLGRGWAIGLTLASVLLSLALVMAGVGQLRSPSTTAPAGVLHPNAYWLSVAFEAVAIPLAVFILKRWRQHQYILPIIALIVGLHFFVLVPAFGSFEFAWIGSAMSVIALATIWFLPPTVTWRVGPSRRQVDLWRLVVGIGCTAVLWCLAVMLLWFRN
jgi:hypothetical protein